VVKYRSVEGIRVDGVLSRCATENTGCTAQCGGKCNSYASLPTLLLTSNGPTYCCEYLGANEDGMGQPLYSRSSTFSPGLK